MNISKTKRKLFSVSCIWKHKNRVLFRLSTDISVLVFQHEIWMKIVFASIFVTKTFMFKIVLHSLFCIIVKLCVIFP